MVEHVKHCNKIKKYQEYQPTSNQLPAEITDEGDYSCLCPTARVETGQKWVQCQCLIHEILELLCYLSLNYLSQKQKI